MSERYPDVSAKCTDVKCRTSTLQASGTAGVLAQADMTDIRRQLSTLLGREVKQLRTTDETPPRISVIDVAVVITGHGADYASQTIRGIWQKHPEVREKITDFKFPGKGQRKTQVVDAKGMIEIVILLPGTNAARVRHQAATLLCRFLGGDLSIVDEVYSNRAFQEELAARAPADPRRVFGEAVESSSSSSSPPLVQVLSNMHERLTKQEQMLTHIHERLGQDRQRVNLNVRAPKRTMPHQPPIARDIGDERPFPISKFLDEKERQDPSWKHARRSFAPSFGMVAQVLKKNMLRSGGKPAIYVEQNSRPQLLYTDEDRGLLEETWTLTKAHREDLAGLPGNITDPPTHVVRRPCQPTVLDLLQRNHA